MFAFQRRPARAFTLVELLVVISIIGILMGLMMPVLSGVRESGRRTVCSNNIRQLGMACNLYHKDHGMYPPAIQVLGSEDSGITTRFGRNWIISILPYFDQLPTYKAFDLTRPISDPANRDPRSVVIKSLLCPSDVGATVPYSRDDEGDNWARGNYAANSSLDFLNKDNVGMSSKNWNIGWKRGLMGCNASADPSPDDGESHTILIAEVRIGLSDSDRRGTWAMAAPGASSLWGHGQADDIGPNACGDHADTIKGSSEIVAAVGEKTMKRECMTCATQDLNQQATARSRHSAGGVNVCMADGSVHFISNGIEKSSARILTKADMRTWERLNASSDHMLIDDSKW